MKSATATPTLEERVKQLETQVKQLSTDMTTLSGKVANCCDTAPQFEYGTFAMTQESGRTWVELKFSQAFRDAPTVVVTARKGPGPNDGNGKGRIAGVDPAKFRYELDSGFGYFDFIAIGPRA